MRKVNFYMSIGARLGILRRRAKYNKKVYKKYEIKTTITLIYAPTYLTMYVFITASTFGILRTPSSYFGLQQWSKGTIVIEKHNLFLVGLRKG